MIKKKKKILFVVGLALGHIGRCLVIAKRLFHEAPVPVEIYFTGPSKGFAKKIIPSKYPFYILPYEDPGDTLFNNELEKVVKQLSPDLICLDLTPIPWLVSVNIKHIPQVFITNFFLTQLGAKKTFQDELFKKEFHRINQFREKNKLEPFTSAREMYERDTVILCDPSFLAAQEQGSLPSHYHFVGPCSWESDAHYPKELEDRDNFLLISFGSTGVKPLPYSFVEALAGVLEIETVIWMGGTQRHHSNQLKGSSVQQLFYTSLPTTQVLSRSTFAITQGGAGSTYQAMMHDVPVGVWASHINQTILGECIQEYGNGMLIETPSLVTSLHIQQNLEVMSARSESAYNLLSAIDGPSNAAKIIMDMLEI